MEKLDGKSMDLEKHSIEKIKVLFPEVVTEGRIDFDKLRLILGDEVDQSTEKYQFTWNGKSQTIKLAQKPSTGTLRPAKDESKDWDTTKNLYIEGDNLEVLKQLQKTYFGKIKMIYIDPPYNTGGDFIYKDDFKDSLKNYKEQTNQTSRSNADTSGRYHTDWLNMMYSRLLLAKNLLSNDGVIFISIDDHELENLLKIGKEIFGENNYIGQWNWFKSATPPNLSFKIKKNIEYIIAFEKNRNTKKYYGVTKTSKSSDPMTKPQNTTKKLVFPASTFQASFEEGVIEPGIYGTEKYPNKLLNKMIVEKGTNVNEVVFENRFIWVQDTLNEMINRNTLFYLSKNLVISYKKSEYDPEVPPNLINDKVGVTTTENAGKSLTNLMSLNVFDYPKPISLIQYLTNFLRDDCLTVLDFFSGSATTAHAVMKLNAEDGGNRKFIMVQLPDKTDEKSEAYKAGYKNICEIGKERVRRAGELIKQELEKEVKDSSKLDIGFKVFKLDDTNIKEWDSSQEVTDSTLFDQQEVFKERRTAEDVLYEILLKYGVFDMPVSETLINDKVAYDIGHGDMIVALFDDITSEDIKVIADNKPRVVIFKDSGFANDNVKLNALHNLEKQGVEDVKSI